MQFAYLVRYLGTPAYWSPYLQQLAAEVLEGLPYAPPLLFDTLRSNNVDPECISLLQQMTTLDPESRPSAKELLEHAFLADVPGIEDENVQASGGIDGA